MTNQSIYNRQANLPLMNIYCAAVVGLGGTGTWTALFLAMAGAHQLHLMDFDRLEASNLNRLPYAEDDLGKQKTEVAAELIKRIRPDTEIYIHQEANELSLSLVTKSGFNGSDVWFFDCTDKLRTQRMIYEFTAKHKNKYIRCGYDGLHMTVCDYVGLSAGSDDEAGYRITPSWVCTPAVAAGIAVGKAMLATKQDVSIGINEIGAKVKL